MGLRFDRETVRLMGDHNTGRLFCARGSFRVQRLGRLPPSSNSAVNNPLFQMQRAFPFIREPGGRLRCGPL